METNKIIQGDCLKELKKIPNNSIDLVITDPPYGVEFGSGKFFDDSKQKVFNIYKKWIKEISKKIKEGSHLYFFVPTLEIDKWVSALKKFFNVKNILASNIYILVCEKTHISLEVG